MTYALLILALVFACIHSTSSKVESNATEIHVDAPPHKHRNQHNQHNQRHGKHARLINKSTLLTHSNTSDGTDGGEYVENKANR
jgi:hypothetical protein